MRETDNPYRDPAKAGASSKPAKPRGHPRGRHALAPEDVLSDRRERLLAAVPAVAAEYGYSRTPAMAAGVADHIWSLEEIAALLD